MTQQKLNIMMLEITSYCMGYEHALLKQNPDSKESTKDAIIAATDEYFKNPEYREALTQVVEYMYPGFIESLKSE